MAIEKDQLTKIMSDEGEIGSKADSILALINEEVESQLTRVKLNREEIKEEKTAEIAKRHAAEKQVADLTEQNAKLQKQLEDSSPDSIQKIWEQKLQDAANMHATQQSELQKEIESLKRDKETLLVSQKKLECTEEFNRAIRGKNIAPECLEDFQNYVLGPDCYKFSLKPTGDGDKQIYATKEGLTIKQVTDQACLTTFGKNCILNNSFGGGAEGGSRGTSAKDNPFITKNLTAQLQLMRDNPQLYEQMKAQAALSK